MSDIESRAADEARAVLDYFANLESLGQFAGEPMDEQKRVYLAFAPIPRLSSMVPKEKISQVHVGSINIVGIPSGTYLTDDEVKRFTPLEPPIEGKLVDELISPWPVDDEIEVAEVEVENEAA